MLEKFGEWNPETLKPFGGLARLLKETGFDQSQRMWGGCQSEKGRGNGTHKVMALENSEHLQMRPGLWLESKTCGRGVPL